MLNPDPPSPRLPLAARVLIGLVAGFAIGLTLDSAGPSVSRAVLAVAEPLGALFIAAIRMTIIPLVVASLIVALATAPDTRTVGAIGLRALALFVALLLAGATFSALVAPALFARMPLAPDAVAALRATASGTADQVAQGARAIPSAGQWLVDLVPTNVFRAASDGAILPLIVFALAFGVALGRIGAIHRAAVVGVFGAVESAMLLLIRWILVLAPLGVLALAIPLAARVGTSAAGALAVYVAVAVGLMTAFTLVVLYPLAIIGGRIAPMRFVRTALPAQAVAFGSRSSIAALAAMIEATRDRLLLPPPITSFYLPVAVATFRAGSALNQTIGAVFIAYLYGVDLSAAQLATIVVTVVMTTFTIPAVPGGSIIVIVPVLLAAGLPVEGLGVLLAVDTIPDMFRTTSNVTGHLAVAAVLGRKRAPLAAATVERAVPS